MIVQIEYRFSEGNLGLRSNVPLKAVWWAELERKGDDNHASYADSDGNAPPKKSAKSNDDEDGIVVCEVVFFNLL